MNGMVKRKNGMEWDGIQGKGREQYEFINNIHNYLMSTYFK